MLKIILISAPYIDFYGPIKVAAGYYFPLGLGYIASFIRKEGISVSLYEPEAQHLSYHEIGKIFAKEKPDVVGIGAATPSFYNAIEIAKLAKSCANSTVVLGGIHASALPEFIVSNYHNYFDYLVVGEGEYTMKELLENLTIKQSPLNVPGLCFWHEGKVVKTEPRALIKDLDCLPYPARELIPQDLFKPNTHNIRHKKCLTMITSRGCPYHCSFCASGLTMGKQYRMHSAEYVLGEMTYLKQQYGAQQLIINDDTFTINKERLINICEGMIKRKLNLSWFCFAQVATVDKELLKLMKRAGCFSIGFGVESASERILKLMGKPIAAAKCREVFNAANQLGIKTQAFFVFGMPDETMQEINDTINFAIQLKPTLAFFNMLVPFPGTKDFEVFFQGIPLEKIDWKSFVAIGAKSVTAKARDTQIDLEKMTYQANLKFYLRPSQLLHIFSRIKTHYELQSYFTGGIGLVRQMLSWRR